MDANALLATLLIVSAVGYALLALRLWTRRLQVANLPIAMTFGIVGVWVFSGAVELLAESPAVFAAARVGHFLGTSLVPVTLFVCFRDYIGRSTSKTMTAVLCIVPVSSIIVAATNSWHEFMWYLPLTNEAGEFLTRPRQWGPWFWYLHSPHGYALIGLSVLTLVMHSSAVAPAHRRGLFMLAASAVIPVVTIVAYDNGVGPATMSIVPAMFACMLPFYAWLIIGEEIVENSPLAYETVFQHMQDPMVVLDDQRRVIGLNHGAERLLQVNEHDALRAPLEAVFGDQAPEVYEALDSGQPQKMLTSSGRFLHVQVSSIRGHRAAAGHGRVLMFRDVSDVEKAQREVRHRERLLRSLIDHSVNGIIRLRWVTGKDASRSLRCVFANGAAGRYLGVEPDDMIEQTADDIIKYSTSGMPEDDAASIRAQFHDATQRGRMIDTEVRAGNESGGPWLRLIGEPVGEDVAVTFIDISDKKAKELQMESIAWSDPLTGVLNRRGFERDAAARLLDSADDASGALLFIDLNDFKQINDRHGHEAGDELLRIAADRLRASLRPGDIIGRPGGDEFVALVPDVKPAVAEELAERLAQALEEAYVIDGTSLSCSASIGLSLYPAHANTLTGLMRAADQAMYRAKARRRGPQPVGRRNGLERAS